MEKTKPLSKVTAVLQKLKLFKFVLIMFLTLNTSSVSQVFFRFCKRLCYYKVTMNLKDQSLPPLRQSSKRGAFSKLLHTVRCESKGVTFTCYHRHFESEIQIQDYCILRIHACVPLTFLFLQKKKQLYKIYFLFVYQFVAKRLYFVW